MDATDDGYHVCMLSCFSCVQLFKTLWVVVHQAPLLVGFSRQLILEWVVMPPPVDLPDPRIKPTSLKSPALQVDSLPTEPPRISALMTKKIRVKHLRVTKGAGSSILY